MRNLQEDTAAKQPTLQAVYHDQVQHPLGSCNAAQQLGTHPQQPVAPGVGRSDVQDGRQCHEKWWPAR